MSIEAKLRPAVEIVPSIASIIAGGVLIISPELFLIPETMAYIIGGLFIILGCVRFFQATSVWRYQKNLRRLPRSEE
ncbi:MAG: DUF308 domain-containing protein, partial [Mariprofundaceae bacterium]|nr:DUF308 domain-containing protein [Mariprofundaceae bacterium]